MKDEFFLDTNIFVYSFDKDATKSRIAKNLIAASLENNNAMISTQVVQEFLNVATRKFKPPLPMEDSRLYLEKVLSPLCEIFPNLELFGEALSIHARTAYSYYDSLIIAAALQGGCTHLYSEDMQHGHSIAGLKIVNPFRQER